jgi:hypothetical protein
VFILLGIHPQHLKQASPSNENFQLGWNEFTCNEYFERKKMTNILPPSKITMKIATGIVFLFLINNLYSQTVAEKIDTSNYYNHYIFAINDGKKMKGSPIETKWLEIIDAIPIIVKELEQAGFDELYEFALYKLPNGQHVVLSVYSRKSKFGILYITGHNMTPNKIDRRNLTQKGQTGVDYVEIEQTSSGSSNFIKINSLPSNIYVLNENCYWFQNTKNKAMVARLVSRDDIIKILKQDVQAISQKVKDNTH